MKTVGILGGMGPEATILLMQKVLAAVPARDDGDVPPCSLGGALACTWWRGEGSHLHMGSPCEDPM